MVFTTVSRGHFACFTYFYSYIYNVFSLSSPPRLCVPDAACVVLSHKWLMTPLHVAEKLPGWIVLERGTVKFTASTKQLWTTRLGIAHNTIQSSLSLSCLLTLFLHLPHALHWCPPPSIYLYLGSLDLLECSGS